MKRKSNLLSTLGLLFVAVSLHALTPDEWKFRQPLDLDATGPVKFTLPITTLDVAQPDLRDLRILGPDAKEVPYLLVKPAAVIGQALTPKDFKTELANSTTIITLATGTDVPLESIELDTGAHAFLKAVQVELSTDGQQWRTFAEGVPVFRQDGAAKTAIALDRNVAAFVRLNFNDERTRPVIFTGATLQTATDQPAPTELLAPRITSSEEFSGETVITLDLGAAHLSLSSLEFITEDPLFTRTVSLTVRELRDGQIVERTLARGTIYRIALEGLAPSAGLYVPLQALISRHELIVHIENGDSPPLRISEIRARRNPIYAIIAPGKPGHFEILTGNPTTNAPRYDLAALSNELSRLPPSNARIGETTTNAAFQQADPLAGLTLEGADLDAKPWKNHRAVTIAGPGVQQLELDLSVLAAAQTDFSDLRLIQSGKQVPYIFERTGLTRTIGLTPKISSAHERESTTMSQWKVILPHSGLPLTRLSLISPTRLFARRIHVYETLTNNRGESYQRSLASMNWTQTPDEPSQPLSLTFSDPLLTDTLWIETDNGDNPPITLERAQASYPVIRLLCKITSTEPVELIYGNDSATAPRYDVGLIAAQLLTAEKRPATLGAAATTAASSSLLKGAHGGALFWAVLAVVVILLLVVVAKLLPKPNK